MIIEPRLRAEKRIQSAWIQFETIMISHRANAIRKKMAKGLRLESVHIPEHINVSIVSRNSLKKHTRSIWNEALVHSPRCRRPKGSRWHSSRRLSKMDTLCCATAFRPNTAQNKLQSRPETLDVSVFPATIVVNLSICSLLICFEIHMRITTAFAGPA